MKKLLTFLLVAALAACSKSEDGGTINTDPIPEKPKAEIKLNASSSNFTADGGRDEISFSSTEAWTAEVINSRVDDWCSISPTSGDAGEATITISTKPNDTTNERLASVRIKAGSASKTITVSQKQKDALIITSSKFEVAAEGGEVEIEVRANINFEYTIDDSAKKWISYEGTRAMKTSTLTFNIAENDDTEKREGKITIKSGEFNEVVTIYQTGREPSIVISQNEYIVSSDGETISVEVTCNVDVSVEIPVNVDWISENTTRTTSTNTYCFDIQPNEDYDQRSTEIKFTNKENNLSEVVKVMQVQKDAIVLAKDSYTVDCEGGQIQIEVGHNIDFDIDISANWITKVENTRAFSTENLIFSVAPNTAKQDRTGIIKISSLDNTISHTINVFQKRYNSFDPSIGDWGDGGENGGTAE